MGGKRKGGTGRKREEESAAEEEGCFSSLIRNHCMSRGSNEIAAIKMMPVYMPRVLGSRKGREYKASSGFVRRGIRYTIRPFRITFFKVFSQLIQLTILTDKKAINFVQVNLIIKIMC